jgi:hypothetical protein
MSGEEDPLRRDARAAFAFLERELGFVEVELGADGAGWDSPALGVRVGREKGSVDVLLVARVDTPVLRPYVSHTFPLLRVLPLLAPGCLRGVCWPADEGACLARMGKLLREHGTELLRGDLGVLERLSRGGAPPRRE